MGKTELNEYLLFIDESGDHGLVNIDINFPVFVLCGIIISADNYIILQNQIRDFKNKYWQTDKVILHSRDIRKCNNEFSILIDLNIKKSFYNDLNTIISSNNFLIVTSIIDKIKFINYYGKLFSDIYEISLSFVIEKLLLLWNQKKKIISN